MSQRATSVQKPPGGPRAGFDCVPPFNVTPLFVIPGQLAGASWAASVFAVTVCEGTRRSGVWPHTREVPNSLVCVFSSGVGGLTGSGST